MTELKTGTIPFSMKPLMTLVIALFFGVPGLARYEFVTLSDGQQVVQTFAKKGEGIASIVRGLGLKPNWTDQSWIQKIQAANPSLVEGGNNFVLSPNAPLMIPLSAVSNLQGYSTLASRFTPVETVVETITPQPVVTEVIQETVTTPIVETPVVASGGELSTQAPGHSFDRAVDVDFYAGYGFNNLFAEQSSIVDTSLNSENNVYAALNFGFMTTDNQRMNLFAQARYIKYSEPTTIGLLQDNPWVFDLGATYGFRVGAQTFLNLIWTSQMRHFARFNFTNIEILAPWIHGIGVQLTGPLFSFTNSAIWYTLTPKYLLSTTDTLTIESGVQAALRLQLQPHLSQPGFIYGAEYVFTNQNDTIAQQTYQTVMGFLGYRF